MSAVDYLRTKYKICEVGCEKCPLQRNNTGYGFGCGTLENVYPAEAVRIVQKWAEKHRCEVK